MAKKRGKHSSIWEPQTCADTVAPSIDLDALGISLKRLPPAYWEPSMMFRGALDLKLREITGDFPMTLRREHRTHPLFVLERVPGLGHRVCPCSSRNFKAPRRIRKGCVLIYSRRETDRDSYLVESCAFTLPEDPSFLEPLVFLGKVPAECLEGCAP